ncbi:MAG: putative family Mn2+/Fe2+ transporter [Candidatus Nomurabacteria bacterium]|nr:putative family Mn2+/Fe2+ transporter [Candidatus Nomurabacteria bacterium]
MKNVLKRIKKAFGPGVITGIADDDPSGIATYAQTGAVFGLTQLWLALYCIPFMISVQEMCGRIGMVTGKGITTLIKSHYSKPVLFLAITLLSIANVVNIGADVGAMSQALAIISPLSFGVGIFIFTIFTIFTAIYIPYKIYVKCLKWFALSVLAYVFVAFMINHDWVLIFKALVIPNFHWEKEYLINIMAMLGTTISPYLFFWQANEEIEEEIETNKLEEFGKGTPKVTRNDLKQMRTDTVIGMAASNIITFFIIITSASLISSTPGQVITATDLIRSLTPLAGGFSAYLFAIAIIGTGLLALPVLAGSAAYAWAEAIDEKVGLGKTFKEAKWFYVILALVMLIGALLNVFDVNPVAMLYYSAAINGILAAPLLFIIIHIANNKRIMRENTNSKLSNILNIFIAIVMGLIALFTIESFFRP